MQLFQKRIYGKNGCSNMKQSLYQEMFNEEMKWFVEKCILEGKQPISTMEDAKKVRLTS